MENLSTQAVKVVEICHIARFNSRQGKGEVFSTYLDARNKKESVMGKFYLVAAASVLLALAGSAEAGGRGRTSPGATFTPPGFSSNTVGQSHAGWSTTNNVTTGGVQPPGWSHNSTGQINGSWSDSIGGTGGIPGGLAGH